MSFTSLMAPLPTSPHIIFLLTGPKISYPQLFSTVSWFSVIGWSHIIVFIEGHTTMGCFNLPSLGIFCIGHARHTNVSRLSHSPLDILASVFALKGAINRKCAHFLSSICSTGSPLLFHISHSIQSQQIKLWQFDSAFSQLAKNCLPFLIPQLHAWQQLLAH